MNDREILIWIHQRLVKVHGESEYADYMHALRDVIYGMPQDRDSQGGVVTMHSNEVLDVIKMLDLAPKEVARMKAWSDDIYEVYVRNYNYVKSYKADDIQHYVYSKELSDEEKGCGSSRPNADGST